MANGGWVATFEDITEQTKFEEERERQREFLNEILDNVPAMVVVKDAINGSSASPIVRPRRFGAFREKRRSARRCTTSFRNRAADLMEKADNEALNSVAPVVQGEHPSMVISGDGRIVTSKRHAIRDSDGTPRFLVSVVEDVSERKRIEQERDRDREFLNQIIDSVRPRSSSGTHSETVCSGQSGGDGALRRPARTDHRQDRHPMFSKETADLIARHDEQLLQSGGTMFFDEYPLDSRGKGLRTVARGSRDPRPRR